MAFLLCFEVSNHKGPIKFLEKKFAFHPKIILIESHLQRPVMSNVSNNAGTHPLPHPTCTAEGPQTRIHWATLDYNL